MLQQKLARLASDFASQVIHALAAAPIDELIELTQRPASHAKPKAVTKGSPMKKRRATRSPTTNSAPPPAPPNREVTTAALAFFAERGPRGATAPHLGTHLTELGLSSPPDIVDALAKSGAIRDAGFRRAAGKNATSPVYVAT